MMTWDQVKNRSQCSPGASELEGLSSRFEIDSNTKEEKRYGGILSNSFFGSGFGQSKRGDNVVTT